VVDITPSTLYFWSGGRLLAFSGLDGQTDFYHGLTARTAFEGLGIDVKLPGECRLRLPVGTPESAVLAGDYFLLETESDRVRGAFLDACHFLIEGPCKADKQSNLVTFIQRESRTLIGSAVKFNPEKIDSKLDAAIADRRRWNESIRLPPNRPELTNRALNGALSQIKTMVYSPEGLIRRRFTTPDRWPHRGMWLWDSAFHAIGIRHIDLPLAREILEAVFDGQQMQGMVPIRTVPADSYSAFTQPPVLALAAFMIEEVEPDMDWLDRVYPKLAAYICWDLVHRDSDGAGLVEWAIEEHENCRSGENGWDNSPRFDSATQLDAVEFNAFLALECEILVKFARRLGKYSEGERWDQAYHKLCMLIDQRLWDDETGFCVDYDVQLNRPSSVLAASGFMPLICGAASPAQAHRLAAHLNDPAMFGAPFPVPTVAVKDTAHYAKDMWRGPVWININWLVAFGLDRYGLADFAAELRRKTVSEIEKFFLKYGTFFEFYDDRQELDPPQLYRKGKLAPEISPTTRSSSIMDGPPRYIST
jgi:glycogen debranching enzyme